MSSGKARPSASLTPAVCEGLLEEAPVGVCVVQDGLIVYENRWLREFCGCPQGEGPPREMLAVIHPDDRPLVSRQLDLRLAGPGLVVRLLAGAGDAREVELHIRGIDLNGRPAVQATLVQSAARIDPKRKLQADAARLEESNRFRQLFGDIVSHDLMNPVWIAENYLRLIMEGGVPDDKASFYDGMRSSLARARGILADARTYLRIQDLVAFKSESVDLGQIVEMVAKSLRPRGDDKGQTITVTRAGSAVVRASPLIKEVVWQLLSNAINFGPPDSAIEVALVNGPLVRLEVVDRGPGVREQDRERIFRRFERMEKGPISGVGLGLAIVRRVVDLHGGRVWVEDNPGGGSRFVAEFPAAD